MSPSISPLWASLFTRQYCLHNTMKWKPHLSIHSLKVLEGTWNSAFSYWIHFLLKWRLLGYYFSLVLSYLPILKKNLGIRFIHYTTRSHLMESKSKIPFIFLVSFPFPVSLIITSLAPPSIIPTRSLFCWTQLVSDSDCHGSRCCFPPFCFPLCAAQALLCSFLCHWNKIVPLGRLQWELRMM